MSEVTADQALEAQTAAQTADPPASTPPASEKKTSTPTSYVVLEQKQEVAEVGGPVVPTKPETLTVVGSYEARSGLQAVGAHLKAKDIDGGTFYAVPARSWQPITVATETKTHLKFS